MSEPENELEQRFPNMRPIRSAPGLSTVNGIGCMLIGGRDHDPETGTYVKTHCFCVLFVPLLSLGAYRVADAPRGWYFIGREPLSGFARAWNWMVLGLILGGIGLGWWAHHTSTPEYQARKKVAEADRLAEAGDVAKAARLYREVARGSTGEAAPAADKFKDLLGDPLDRVSLEQALPVIRMGAEWDRRKDVQAAVFKRGLALAKDKGTAEPRQALTVLELIAPLAEKQDDFAKQRLPLLEKLAASKPDDVAIASALAVTHERLGNTARCEKLLWPLRDRLGVSEGARVLGQVLARQGKDEESFKLLVPYTEEKLPKLEAAGTAIKNAVETITRRLRAGKPPPDFPLERYKAASAERKEVIYWEYVQSRLEGDADYQEARSVLARMGPAVGAALDLGQVRLARARKMANPAARRAELEKAEKTLLAVGGAAAGTATYNFRLGRVYYWMGKHKEGWKLFEAALDKEKRSFDALFEVTMLLREIGDFAQARKLIEEAYGQDVEPKKKWSAALLRALTNTDLDDQVTWLERSDPSDPQVKADLGTARGQQALRKGEDEEAAKYFREAIDGYARMPETGVTLHNAALIYQRLYGVTGDAEALDKSLAMAEKAAVLRPGDSIVLGSLSAHLDEAALRDLIGKRIDFGALRAVGDFTRVRYLYRDAKGKRQLSKAVRIHPGVTRALTQAERGMLLAPKAPFAYRLAAAVHGLTGDVAALRRLDEALGEASLDHSDDDRALKDQLEGKNEARLKEERKVSVARWEKRVEQLRKGGGPTFAVAACTFAAKLMEDETVEPDRVVRLTEEAHAAAPSRATHDALISALLFRAQQRLVKQNPDCAAMVARSRHQLGSSHLMALAVERGGKLRAAALADKDFRRACDLLKEQSTTFPDDPDPWACLLLRATHPEEAARMLAALKKDEAGRLSRAIALKLSPTSASAALESYWGLKLEGNEAEGKAILKACAKRGVPLPLDLD